MHALYIFLNLTFLSNKLTKQNTCSFMDFLTKSNLCLLDLFCGRLEIITVFHQTKSLLLYHRYTRWRYLQHTSVTLSPPYLVEVTLAHPPDQLMYLLSYYLQSGWRWLLCSTKLNLRLVKSSGRLLRTAVCIYGADLWKLNLCCLVIFPLGGADSSTVPNQTPCWPVIFMPSGGRALCTGQLCVQTFKQSQVIWLHLYHDSDKVLELIPVVLGTERCGVSTKLVPIGRKWGGGQVGCSSSNYCIYIYWRFQ